MINTIVEIEHKYDFSEQGFYSKSYLGLDKRLKREVAVKDIIYENLTSESDFESYFDEAYKLSLASHPRILPVYYVGLDHNGDNQIIPRIVTHFFKNGSLNSYLEKTYLQKRTLGLDEVIRYAHDIIQGMIHLHVLDIAHLDLKASNIFIGDDGKMVIGDFGQAKFIKDGIIGAPNNIYPATTPSEANKKKAIDKTADIYQFGLLLYSMLCYDQYRLAIETTYNISTATLKLIFRDKPENVADLKKQFNTNVKNYFNALNTSVFPNRSTYPYYVPQKIQNIINKCLEPVPANRYNNFYQVQSDLNDFIFPKNTSDFYQDLLTNNIHFMKDDKPCIINITETGGKFHLISTKNGNTVNRCNKTDVTHAKLRKELFTFAEVL